MGKYEGFEAWFDQLTLFNSEDGKKLLESCVSVILPEGETVKVWHAIAATAMAISGYPPEVLNMTMEEYEAFSASDEGKQLEEEMNKASEEKLDSLLNNLGIEDEE